MPNETTGGKPLPIYDNRATSTAVASPVQGAASAVEDNKYDCPGDVRFAATSSASGAKGAAVSDDEAGLRIIKFIEGFDKKLEAEGFTHEQRCKVVGSLMSSQDIARGALADRSPAVQPSGAAISLLSRLVTALDGKREANFAGEPGFEFNDQLWALREPARALIATPAPEQEAAQERIEAICDAYESGIGHGLQRDGHKSGSVFSDPDCGKAYEIGYAEGEERAPVEQEATQACSYPSCACVGGGVFKPCVKSGEYREAAQVAPPGAQEVRYQVKQLGWASLWLDMSKAEYDDCDTEKRTLYTAPVPATTLAEQPQGLTDDQMWKAAASEVGTEHSSVYGNRIVLSRPEDVGDLFRAIIAEQAKESLDVDSGHCMCPACKDGTIHDSSCSVHNMPADPNGPCDCSVKSSEECSHRNEYYGPGAVRCSECGMISRSCATATNTNQPEGEKGGAA